MNFFELSFPTSAAQGCRSLQKLFRSISVHGALVVIAGGVIPDRALAAPPASPEGKTISFVVYDWFLAAFNSKFADECPSGLAIGNDEYWWRGLSKAERAEKTGNGLIEASVRAGTAIHRGPHGEDVCFNPTIVADPPMRTVRGKFAYGANLDGTVDGHATAKSCAHEKFVGLDHTPAVDNQLYRFLGCAYGWRKAVGRHIEDNANEQRRTTGLAMILIEITGVSDPRNSADVTVTFYRSVDPYALDATGKPLPYSSYRIQTMPDGRPRFGGSLKGSIKDGVLTTQRGDIALPFYGNYVFMDPTMRDMGLRLEIDQAGATAKGLITGYYDVERYLYYLLGQGNAAAATHGDSCPALYKAAHELADGYPDPTTGICTGISSAFDVTAYAAFIEHSNAKAANANIAQ